MGRELMDLVKHAAIREPSLPSESPAVLILLHGLGSNEQDLIGLAPRLDPSLRVIALRAPHAYGFGGYAWFDVEWDEDGNKWDGEQALESLQALVSLFEDFPTHFGSKPRKLILGGFSQGAMMTLGLLLRRPDLIDGALLMSGVVLPEFVPSGPPSGLAGKPCLVQHGRLDSVLPIQEGRRVAELLQSYSADYIYREYDMAHEVNLESLTDIGTWLTNIP
jgi:phospholipase/carboxylesterase